MQIILLLEGENLTPYVILLGKVEGFEYFVPNPVELFQGYADINGEVPWLITIAELSGDRSKSSNEPGINVLGLEYSVPNPEEVVCCTALIYGVLKWPKITALPLLVTLMDLVAFVPNALLDILDPNPVESLHSHLCIL